MKRSKFSEAQIAFILRQGEEGTAVGEICRKAGISEATYYNWRKSTGGPSQPFLTTQYALSGLSELGTSEGDFIARHSSRVMYVYPQAGLRIRPVHCMLSTVIAWR
jgi:putative transposase